MEVLWCAFNAAWMVLHSTCPGRRHSGRMQGSLRRWLQAARSDQYTSTGCFDDRRMVVSGQRGNTVGSVCAAGTVKMTRVERAKGGSS